MGWCVLEAFEITNGCLNDKEIVLEAVKGNGLALAYASEDLKKDWEICSLAISLDNSFIPMSVQLNPLQFVDDLIKFQNHHCVP